MAVRLDLPFTGVDDLPRVLRSGACTAPVMSFAFHAKTALDLARRIERAAEAEADLAAVEAAVAEIVAECVRDAHKSAGQTAMRLFDRMGMLCVLCGAQGFAMGVLVQAIAGWFV